MKWPQLHGTAWRGEKLGIAESRRLLRALPGLSHNPINTILTKIEWGQAGENLECDEYGSRDETASYCRLDGEHSDNE